MSASRFPFSPHFGWGLAAAVIFGLALVWPWAPTSTTPASWRILGGLGSLLILRLAWTLTSNFTSRGRLAWLMAGLLGAAALAAMAARGMTWPSPSHSRWATSLTVLFPLLLGATALVLLVISLLQWQPTGRPGRPSRGQNWLPFLWNAALIAAAWQVVSQPAWTASLQTLVTPPQPASQRTLLETSLAPWMEIIHHTQPATHPSIPPSPPSPASPQPPKPARAPALARASHLQPSPATPAAPAPAPPASPAWRSHAAAEEWIEAAVHNPDNPALELRAAIALVAAERPDQALGRLAAARKRGCQSPDLIRFHGRLQLSLQRPAAAASLLESLVLSNEGTDEDLRECLQAWEQAGQIDRAEEIAERALVRRPSRELFRWLATRRAAEGDYERALVLLGQLSRRTPMDPADALHLAEVALQAGRPQVALDAVDLLTNSGHSSPQLEALASRARSLAASRSTRSPKKQPARKTPPRPEEQPLTAGRDNPSP